MRPAPLAIDLLVWSVHGVLFQLAGHSTLQYPPMADRLNIYIYRQEVATPFYLKTSHIPPSTISSPPLPSYRVLELSMQNTEEREVGKTPLALCECGHSLMSLHPPLTEVLKPPPRLNGLLYNNNSRLYSLVKMKHPFVIHIAVRRVGMRPELSH